MAVSSDDEALAEILRELPPERRAAVEAFARFLLEQEKSASDRRLTLDWAGALREFREDYASEELEDRALDLWV